MTAKVVSIRLSDADAKKLLAEFASNSENVIYSNHALKQMRGRKISPTQVLNCLRKGKITESPALDIKKSLWNMRIERHFAGEKIGCAVGIDLQDRQVFVITAFEAN